MSYSPSPRAYPYSSLPPGSIRLLRLQPDQGKSVGIQCRISEYPLHAADSGTHLYEALSYVWGPTTGHHSLSIDHNGDSFSLAITDNLHAALLHLRHRFLSRVIWIDAVCINQKSDEEKAQQVSYMAEIYSRSARVIVWLGQPLAPDPNPQLPSKTNANCIQDALEKLRDAVPTGTSAGVPTNLELAAEIQPAIQALLQQGWFTRIWILQEVAAARNVVIKCKSTEMDGFVFCRSLALLPEALWGRIRPITYLIRDAIFRAQRMVTTTLPNERFSLHIRPLGELVDMYHMQSATDRRDKIFALLGMASDDNIAGSKIVPNYSLGRTWEGLFHDLVRFLLGSRVSVDTWPDSEVAVIRGEAYVLGRVSEVEKAVPGKEPLVHVTLAQLTIISKFRPRATPKPVCVGDIVCVLEGDHASGGSASCSKPVIVRPFWDYFLIIRIAVDVEFETIKAEDPARHILFVWDWQMLPNEASPEVHREFKDQVKSQPVPCSSIHLDTETNRDAQKSETEQTRLWNVATILEAVGDESKAKRRFDEYLRVTQGTERLKGKEELAIIYGAVKKWKEAVGLLQEVVKAKWSDSKDESMPDPGIVHTLKYLQSMYKKQGDVINADKADIMGQILTNPRTTNWTADNEVCKTAASFDAEVMTLLLGQNKGIRVTTRVLKAAAGNPLAGAEVMGCLLDREESKTLHVTPDIALAAAGNPWSGERVMKLLLERRKSGVEITEEVVVAAAGNPRGGVDFVKLLLDHAGRDKTVVITEAVVAAAVGNSRFGVELTRFLLNRKRNKVQVTDAIWTAALGNSWGAVEVMQLLLSRRGTKLRMAPNMASQAAGNPLSGESLMKMLLERTGRTTNEITSDAYKAAEEAARQNLCSGPEVVKLLATCKVVSGRRG